ncbi:MAG: hypothetical protein ABI461_12190 [Polyangiaceae bacterium]
MHADLLAQTPLIALPLAALVLFVVVYCVIVIRTAFAARADIASAASIPFEEDAHG